MFKRVTILLSVIFLSSCASKPLENTTEIYDNQYLESKPNTTHVRLHRATQFTGSALGEDCPLVLKVGESETVGLQQNQYVDLYLPYGRYVISVRFKCALTAWKKSLDIDSSGGYQEYETELGGAGQYRMWRVK